MSASRLILDDLVTCIFCGWPRSGECPEPRQPDIQRVTVDALVDHFRLYHGQVVDGINVRRAVYLGSDPT